jgi:DNA-binding CsgD family transcriptional regulator
VALRGRESEVEALERLLLAARAGEGGALVVRGEAGIGKTALLENVLGAASGFRQLQASGVEFEMELPFAELQRLCAPILDGLERLPKAQRGALDAAFALSDGGSAPDPLRVGFAVLTLLSEAAGEQPLLCVVDDAQWLDQASAQALAFVARRLLAEPVALIFAQREPSEGHELRELAELPELPVQGLGEADARDLLAAEIHAPLDQRIRDRIIAEARGNPLALLELPRSAGPTDLARGFGLPERPAVSQRVEASYQARLALLPDDTRTLLLLAAAEPVGDPLLLWRAAAALGLGPEAATPAEAAELLEIGSAVRFRHPLVRSAAYRAASPARRRSVHAALADATDPEVDPDRRVWHLAQATLGLDETVAAELVSSAERARARGGVAAAAAFLERAAALTPDSGDRMERTLLAAEAKLEAGAPEQAQTLIATIDRTAMPDLPRARTEMLRGLIAYSQRRGADAPPLFRQAAQRLESLDARAARETHIHAVLATIAAGSLGTGAREAAAAALAAPPAPEPARTLDELLDGLALLMAGERAKATPMLQRALADPGGEVWMGRPTLLCLVAVELWDLAAYERVLTEQVAQLRAAGALTMMPHALSPLAGSLLPTGRFRAAEALLAESDELAETIGIAPLRYSNMHVAALRGDVDLTTALVEVGLRDATERGEGLLVTFGHYATALLLNGRADYAGALAATRRAVAPVDFSFEGMRLREFIEAAVHAGERDGCAEALSALRERTDATDTRWGRGTGACCAALLAGGATAEEHYRHAADQFERGACFLELGRAELLFGEWLRRENRRTDAREQLQRAYERLSAMGASGFAERALQELRATGERARRRTPETADELTPQELHIARLVATGATSKEVAAELFLSPRTIDAHLRSVFRKLGITSRRQLRNLPLAETAEPTGVGSGSK